MAKSCTVNANSWDPVVGYLICMLCLLSLYSWLCFIFFHHCLSTLALPFSKYCFHTSHVTLICMLSLILAACLPVLVFAWGSITSSLCVHFTYLLSYHTAPLTLPSASYHLPYSLNPILLIMVLFFVFIPDINLPIPPVPYMPYFAWHAHNFVLSPLPGWVYQVLIMSCDFVC